MENQCHGSAAGVAPALGKIVHAGIVWD